MRRQHRLLSHRTPSSLSKSSHIVQENLERKSQLIDRYQSEIQERIQQMGNEPTNRRPQQVTERRSIQKSRLGSARKEVVGFKGGASAIGLNDYQKLILGLEYSLQSERKKVELLQNNNTSLQAQLSNLRNLFLGSSEQKPYEKTMIKEYQDKIGSLEERIVEQKKNYEFIIDSKNEALATFQFQLRTVDKKMKEEEKEGGESRKLLQLMGQIEQLRASLTKKSITIEKMRFHIEQDASSDSSNQEVKQQIRRNKMQFYSQQLQLSNKLIMRKNMQILGLSKKRDNCEAIFAVMEQYLDKKEVKNVDLSVLEHVCVNKLRLLLREKMVVERELLNQLNDCNQKLHQCEQQLAEKNAATGSKVAEVITDNKRLTALVNTLQNGIKNLEKTLDDERRESEMQRNQVEINKRQFVEEIRKMKEELTTISSVTKSEFDRMKIENLKLAQQNRSLLFLVGEKEKQIHKKGEAIRTFEDYKQKINSLDVAEPQRRKIESVGEEAPQMGTKLLLIDNFSGWMMEWNKVRNWNNKKVLLNLILDKPQIREDSLKSMTNLIGVLHETFLNSKSVDLQERAIILLSHYLKYEILKNGSLFVTKLAPIVLRGFRPILEGEDEQKLRLLNESALKILSSMERSDFKWSHEMTNEMLSVNGLRYLFSIVTNSQVDELVEAAYNCLIMISDQNEMISFMNSYNLTTILLTNANIEYPFVVHALHLLKSVLKSQDYIKSQKSLLEFRKIYGIVKSTDDPEIVEVTLDCALLLMDNSLFVKSLNKIEIISILSQAIRSQSDYGLLKKIGEVYQILVLQLQNENVSKMSRQLDKLIDVVNAKKFTENRFGRVIRILLMVAEALIDSKDLDERIIKGVSFLYEFYDSLEAKTRIKLNNIISVVYERNKEVINMFSNESWIINLVEAYKGSSVNEQLVFLLRILLFQHEQRRSTEILRSGRENLIGKHINDALLPDYNVALPALKNLAAIAKQKYSQKFMNKALFAKIVGKEYIGTAISILYYFCKSEETSVTVLECGLLERVFALITERQDKEGLVYKCLSLIELCHTTNYKRKILNYLLSQDANMNILKTLSAILKKAKNKQEMGARAVFIYDFLNGKAAVESFALLVQQNTWMIENLIDLRNEYVGKVDPLVYKIELLLHNVSVINAKIRKIYEKFKVEGDNSSADDR